MFDDSDPFAPTFQTGSTPKPTTGGFQAKLPSSQQQQEKSDYKIVNLFWLINPKVYSEKTPLLPNELHFCSISFNINFGNLRIELGQMNQESIQGHLICLNKINRLVNTTIYPTAMFQLVMNQPQVACMEQIINYNNSEWQNKIKQGVFTTKIEENKNSIILTIGDEYCYEFIDWQRDALIYSCKFGLNQGFNLSGENLMKR